MLILSHLSKSFGPRSLFSNVSIELCAGVRYGLVGANGCGKTTLLRILAGEEPPTDGCVSAPRDARFGILRQDRFLDDTKRIVDIAMAGDAPVWAALEEMHHLELHPTTDPSRVTFLDEFIRAQDGYALRSRASQVLAGLGIPTEVQERNLATLSGGFKLRVLLAQVLLSRPDILLLDEPTNHLDILSIRWLEKFLLGYNGCAVVISHDRRFLDNVATRILDVDYDTLTEYVGNYSSHVQQKQTFSEQQEAKVKQQEKILAEKVAFVERFRAKATKARQAQSRLKQIEKLEVTEVAKSSRRYPHLRFIPVRPSGKDVLTVEGLSKSYGNNRVLTDTSFLMRRGERVAVIGPNGIGKSTLLKCALGQLSVDGGTVTWGHEAKVGYFAQDHADALGKPDQTLLDWLWQFCATQPESWVRGQLGHVLFSGDDAKKSIGALSGGESARLVFARIMIEQPNVLVFDEPTNHLDFEAIDMLIDALQKFEGTVLFVSHDRWFVSQIATRIIELLPSGYRDFPGTFDEYLSHCGDDHLDADAILAKAKEQKRVEQLQNSEPSLNFQRDELKKKRNRLKGLPAKRDAALALVDELEQRLATFDARYAEPGFFERTTSAELSQIQTEQADTQARLSQAIGDWEALELEISELEQLVNREAAPN
jgi:ATPase subunit of ABC transporter with duplicated ATPase domains